MINVHSRESRINQVWISETNAPFHLRLSFYLLFLPGGLRLWPRLPALHSLPRDALNPCGCDAHIHLPPSPSQIPAWNCNLLLPLNALPFIVLSSVCFTIKPTISGKLKKGGKCDSGQWWSFLTFISDKNTNIISISFSLPSHPNKSIALNICWLLNLYLFLWHHSSSNPLGSSSRYYNSLTVSVPL